MNIFINDDSLSYTEFSEFSHDSNKDLSYTKREVKDRMVEH